MCMFLGVVLILILVKALPLWVTLMAAVIIGVMSDKEQK